MDRLHKSILVPEIIDLLRISPSGVYADLTFGEGGHSDALLDAGAGRVIGVDRDKETLERYEQTGKYASDKRLTLVHSRLSEFSETVTDPLLFDGFVVDLGVSTRQLLEPHRGFSFNHSGPLDMRMDRKRDRPLSECLGEWEEEELGLFLKESAGIPGAFKVARRVLEAAKNGTLRTTDDLAVMMGPKRSKRHPATTLFMALRMAVNDELGEVSTGIPALIERLKPNGRLAIMTFHSTEDRLVKRLLKVAAGRCTCDEPICRCSDPKKVEWLTKKPILPGETELQENPRARSAKLRCVEKLPQEN